jgi:hypothetical protein
MSYNDKCGCVMADYYQWWHHVVIINDDECYCWLVVGGDAPDGRLTQPATSFCRITMIGSN